MIVVSIMVIGGIALARLPLAFLPNIDVPFIVVNVPYPNSNPSQIEKEIAKPVEEVLATLPGMKHLNSRSSADNVFCFLEFNWGDDLDIVRMQVSEKMELVKADLPDGIGEIRIFTWNTAEIPVIEGRISARGVDLSSNYDLLEARVINPIRRVSGVARVDLDGVAPREIFIELSLAAIKAHSVDVGDVIRRMSGAASNLVLGQVNASGLRYSARAVGSFESIEALVDSGATCALVPETILAGLGVVRIDRQTFVIADGTRVERDIGEAVIRIDGRPRTSVVVFGDANAEPLLGAVTLEEFGLGIDPVGRRLVPMPGYLVGLNPEDAHDS